MIGGPRLTPIFGGSVNPLNILQPIRVYRTKLGKKTTLKQCNHMHTGEGTGDNIGLANPSSHVRTAYVRVHITAIRSTTRSSSDDLPLSLYARFFFHMVNHGPCLPVLAEPPRVDNRDVARGWPGLSKPPRSPLRKKHCKAEATYSIYNIHIAFRASMEWRN